MNLEHLTKTSGTQRAFPLHHVLYLNLRIELGLPLRKSITDSAYKLERSMLWETLGSRFLRCCVGLTRLLLNV